MGLSAMQKYFEDTFIFKLFDITFYTFPRSGARWRFRRFVFHLQTLFFAVEHVDVSSTLLEMFAEQI